MKPKANPLSIIGECHAEKALIKYLLKIEKCGKEQGKTVVMSKMKKFEHSIGIIDHDKDLDNSREVHKYTDTITDRNDKYFIIKKKPQENRYLIILKPDLEKWIQAICALSKIKIEDYGFAPGFAGLKRESKTIEFENNHNFKRLIKDLVDKQNPEILKLQSWLINFMESYGENIL